MNNQGTTQEALEAENAELIERLRFGCPFKPYSKENGVAAYDVPKAERVMLAAADHIERTALRTSAAEAESARLREALAETTRDILAVMKRLDWDSMGCACWLSVQALGKRTEARSRAALAPSGEQR